MQPGLRYEDTQRPAQLRDRFVVSASHHQQQPSVEVHAGPCRIQLDPAADLGQGLVVPREFVFMDRAAIGLGAVFIHLRASLNWHRLFESLIEDFGGDTALFQRLYQALCAESAVQSLSVSFDYRQVPLLFDWAQAGDTVAQDSIRIVAEELAFAVVQLEHMLNPELLVLDGGLGAHAGFRAQVNRALQPHGLQVHASRFGSGVSGQAWATPGQAGAALLALSRLAPLPRHTILTT